MPSSHKYLIYGLKISVNQSIPGLIPVPNSEIADVNIALLGQQQKQLPFLSQADWSIHPNSKQQTGVKIWQSPSDDGTYFRLQSLASESQAIEFIINPSSSRVWAFWSDKKQFSTVVSLLLGSVLGRVLLLRGVLCLHASVISINGKAIAIIGPSTAGKSTTAAALAQRGFSVLTEDITALKYDGSRFWVQPGYPRLRLWSNSLNALGCSVEDLSKVSMYAEKRYLDLNINSGKQWHFQKEPLPLSQIYLLDKRDSALIKPQTFSLSPGEALGELAANIFKKTMLDKQRLASNFQQLSQLVQMIPIQRLERPNDLASLPLICEIILENLKY